MAYYHEEREQAALSSTTSEQPTETLTDNQQLIDTQPCAVFDETKTTNEEQRELPIKRRLRSNSYDKAVNTVVTTDTDEKQSGDNSTSVPTGNTSEEIKDQQELKQSVQQKPEPSSVTVNNNNQQDEQARQDDIYFVKWIEFDTNLVPILLQNENGPCPLLAIMNVLLIRQKIRLNGDVCILSADRVLAYLVDFLFKCIPKNIPAEERLNYEQNVNDAMAVLDKLKTGLDVNVKFDGVHKFEYTRECVIFDLLGIQLLHGWLIDPQETELLSIIGDLGYNQLVEKIITQRHSDKEELIREKNNASQLTYHGLIELNQTMRDNQLAVLFRNNHFSTIYKRNTHLLVLVTDQGFLNQPDIVWETLRNIDGDSIFCNGHFRIFKKQETETEHQDYRMALALRDEEERLYKEGDTQVGDTNYRAQQQQQQQQQQQPQQSLPRQRQQPQGDVPDKKHHNKKKSKEQLDKGQDNCILS
ncbi:unnamed protein product [Didymodactylos carnosus]|uniref:Ubiquitin carboxyl-terminal hydrolase n=1 Tax=Didymodactylos carnosus TaxID=1234261 RepID=A0A8S2DJM2_9BILA|nr:unnamed protein product [Didymodactylos carnosus]CAF3698772.1 unnamed protein product [Didymodactylos carnosus]